MNMDNVIKSYNMKRGKYINRAEVYKPKKHYVPDMACKGKTMSAKGDRENWYAEAHVYT